LKKGLLKRNTVHPKFSEKKEGAVKAEELKEAKE